MTPEGRLMREIMLAVCEQGARVIRVNAGTGWIGKSSRRPDGTVIIQNARPFHGVPEGCSDLLGWSPDGRFLALEIKSGRGQPTPEQIAFVGAVNRAGGRAGVVWSVDGALAVLEQPRP